MAALVRVSDACGVLSLCPCDRVSGCLAGELSAAAAAAAGRAVREGGRGSNICRARQDRKKAAAALFITLSGMAIVDVVSVLVIYIGNCLENCSFHQFYYYLLLFRKNVHTITFHSFINAHAMYCYDLVPQS